MAVPNKTMYIRGRPPSVYVNWFGELYYKNAHKKKKYKYPNN